jgi:regulator of protease activity HflC (stomatin/prohibitin superfamily)
MGEHNKVRRSWTKLLIGLFVALFIIVVLWPSVAISIRPGEVGVLYSRLFGGTVRDRIYDEGIHFILPWNTMYIYDARVREESTEIKVLSREGLAIDVSASIRYRIIRNEVTDLHVNYGPIYERVLIRPVFFSSIREAIGQYSPEELYSTAPEEIQEKALIEAVHELGRLPVQVEAILFKWVRLPDGLSTSIETKLVEEQEVLRYQFILERTYKEALRRVIEGEGIRLYQEAINAGMTENFLRFKGIEATAELAASANSKIIVVGGKDGLPLILNPDAAIPPPQRMVAPAAPVPVSDMGGLIQPDPDSPATHPQLLPPVSSETPGDILDQRLGGLSNHLRDLWDTIGSAKIPARIIDSSPTGR